MDLFERKEIEIDLEEHGLDGVKVTLRQMNERDSSRLLNAKRDEGGEDALDVVSEHVIRIDGVNAGGEPVENFDALKSLLDNENIVSAPLAKLMQTITSQLIIISKTPQAIGKNT